MVSSLYSTISCGPYLNNQILLDQTNNESMNEKVSENVLCVELKNEGEIVSPCEDSALDVLQTSSVLSIHQKQEKVPNASRTSIGLGKSILRFFHVGSAMKRQKKTFVTSKLKTKLQALKIKKMKSKSLTDFYSGIVKGIKKIFTKK
ncbi:hypothetical protein HMI56_005064 [Coelomomyces lativittatus]|nr:hypothetical protein HMI56_005064 [Coelomomyces lativittatus]